MGSDPISRPAARRTEKGSDPFTGQARTSTPIVVEQPAAAAAAAPIVRDDSAAPPKLLG